MRVLSWWLLLAGCAAGSTYDGDSSATPAATPVTFQSVTDGDTIETSGGTVRIIGIDAPESGECGYAEASALISTLLSPGDQTMLELPEGQNDQDRHGRILRYVAGYDSTDGYPAHPRETDYHAAQIATLTADGTVTTVACQAAADAAEQNRIMAEQEAPPAPVPPPAVDEWWRQYTSCTKLKNNIDGHPTGPFSRDNPAEAAIYEWFANGTGNDGDGEGDGLACE
jgi:micrococcal nuclease